MIRLRDVNDGEHIIISGLQYRVLKNEQGIVLKRTINKKIAMGSYTDARYGLNCQMWVDVVDRKKPNERFKEFIYEDGYTNISGHLKTIEKYSK